MSDYGACPGCGESMTGEAYPGLTGRHRDLRVGIQLTYIDRHIVVIWRCPYCGHGWPRFDDGPLHDRAVAHLKSPEQTGFERRATDETAISAHREPERLPEPDPPRLRPAPGKPGSASLNRPRTASRRTGGSPSRLHGGGPPGW